MKWQASTIIVLAINFILMPEGMADGSKIRMWVRGSGNYTDGNSITPTAEKTYTLKALKQETRRIRDVQYGDRWFQGVPLVRLIDRFANARKKSQSFEDMILLHFRNRMIIPIPIHDSAALGKLDILVATKVRTGEKSPWRPPPRLARKHEVYRDPRPITFTGNKIAIATKWFPRPAAIASKKHVPVAKGKEFSPWRHVDSLVGIEFVEERAYFRQFQARKALDQDLGFRVFQRRCQFCHGIRKIGAQFGWDYLDPVPIYELKKPKHTYQKVKYPYHDAFERGVLMPQQKDLTQAEVYVMWGWLKALGRQKKLQSYRPQREEGGKK